MLLAVALCYGFFSALGFRCPLKHLFGLSCPGCGMTRAIVAAFRLDYAAAFYYHPLWVVMFPLAGWMLWLYGSDRRRWLDLTLWCSVAVLIAVYLVRLFFFSQEVVYFRPEQGVISGWLIRWIGSLC